MKEALTYYPDGNIHTLSRDGKGASTYSYSSNWLTGISGATLSSGTYSYDANGNTTRDGRTNTTLAYNVLNLPRTATRTGQGITYTYDAAGSKLRRVSGTETRDYVDGIEYSGGASTSSTWPKG